MFDNSFYGSANIGGYTITVGDYGYGGYPTYPSYPNAPVYFPTQPAVSGMMDATTVMILILVGVLLFIK